MLEIRVPAALLLDKRLRKSTRLVAMLLKLRLPAKPTLGYLHRRSGLARSTVLYALRQLEENPWVRSLDPARGAGAAMPKALLLERNLGISARLLYGVLQLLPRYRGSSGEFTCREIHQLTGMCTSTVIRALTSLQALGWIQVRQAHKYAPVQFTLLNPDLERQKKELAAMERRINEAPYRGEALMREYLSLVVDSDEYEDNANPGFLVNPYTNEKVEFDRYYPPGVAFEFNGPQHYKPTALYPDETAVQRQIVRDLVKIGICQQRGIALRIVHPKDLQLEKMRELAKGMLPLRDLEGHELAIQYLERVSRSYRRRAALGPLEKPKEAISAPRKTATSRS